MWQHMLGCDWYVKRYYLQDGSSRAACGYQYIIMQAFIYTHTHLTALCPGLPGWAGTRKVKINLDFTEVRDSEWQWHQLDHMQVCTSLQTDNRANNPPLSFLQARCPSCRPTNSVKTLKVTSIYIVQIKYSSCVLDPGKKTRKSSSVWQT